MGGRCNTTHDQVALANSRVFARDQEPTFAYFACGIRLGAGSRCPSAIFRPSGAERLRTESPFTAVRRCILTKSVAWREGANGHALSLAGITRAGREQKRVEDVVLSHANVCAHR
jgi:hypothetical protein